MAAGQDFFLALDETGEAQEGWGTAGPSARGRDETGRGECGPPVTSKLSGFWHEVAVEGREMLRMRWRPNGSGRAVRPTPPPVRIPTEFSPAATK